MSINKKDVTRVTKMRKTLNAAQKWKG